MWLSLDRSSVPVLFRLLSGLWTVASAEDNVMCFSPYPLSY